jgi:hypothetical protein
MNVNAEKSKSPGKKLALIVVVLLVTAGVVFGGWTAYKKQSSRPLTPEETKELVADYLTKQTGKKEFKVPLEITKEKNPWQILQVAYQAPPDYKTVYRAIGEHLFVADTMLASSDEKERAWGMRILLGVTTEAIETAYDPWLSARIDEAYLLPNLDKFEDSKHGPNSEQLMHYVMRAYREAEENDNLVNAYKLYLEKYGSSSRADDVRRRIAYLLRSLGKKEEAQKYLSEIGSARIAEKTARKIGTTLVSTNKPTVGTNKTAVVKKAANGTNRTSPRTNRTAKANVSTNQTATATK